MKKFYNQKSLIVFLLCFNIFLIGLYILKPKTRHIIIEESSLGFIPRNIISKKYDLEEELTSFIKIYLFKRYNFTPDNALSQIEESFNLSSKEVEDAIRKNISDNNLIKKIKSEKISQIFTCTDIKYGRSKKILQITAIGERILTRGSQIDSKDNIKLSFLVKMKKRDPVNPYKFYITGIQEEVVK